MKKRGRPRNLIERLTEWAIAEGAEKQALTNPYELVRLRVQGGVAIVYRKDNGKQTWNELAQKIRTAMEAKQPWPDDLRLVEKTVEPFVYGQNAITHRTLIQRDGDGCFYCFEEKTGFMSIEHLVARAHGGPPHISNKFRACTKCNEGAGHLSAPEKIRLREANLLKLTTREKATGT